MRPLLYLLYLLLLLPLLPLLLLPPPTPSPLYNAFVYLSPLSSFLLTTKGIGMMKDKMVIKGLYGLDIGKRGTERELFKVPEAMGVVTGERWGGGSKKGEKGGDVRGGT